MYEGRWTNHEGPEANSHFLTSYVNHTNKSVSKKKDKKIRIFRKIKKKKC